MSTEIEKLLAEIEERRERAQQTNRLCSSCADHPKLVTALRMATDYIRVDVRASVLSDIEAILKGGQ